MTIGIKSKWECPACGSILVNEEVLLKVPAGFKFSGPSRCGCGRRGSFILMSFEPLDVALYNKSDEAVIVPKDVGESVRDYATARLKERNGRLSESNTDMMASVPDGELEDEE